MSNGVNTKLALVIERLDTILEGLTGHADLLTALGDIHTDTSSLAQVLPQIRDEQADIHLDTQSIDLKLLTVRNTLTDVHTDTQSIDAKLLTVRNTLTEIYTQVLNLAPGTFDWEAVLGTPGGSNDNVLAWLAQTIDSLGSPTGDATTTVLGRLSAIETLNFNYLPLIATNTGKCPCGASPPPEGNICAEPYISTGMALVPTALIPNFNSVTIAIWGSTPPVQIEYGTVFGTVSDNSSLVPASGQNWVGRSIFVETSADNFALQTLGTARYPTNTWVDLSSQGTAEISVMVDPSAAVRAYICPDNGGGGGGSWGGGGGGGTWGGVCVTIDSTMDSVYDGGVFSVDRMAIVWPSPFGASGNQPEGDRYTHGTNVILNGAYGAYRVRRVSGYTPRLIVWEGTSITVGMTLEGTDFFTLPAGSTSVMIDGYGDNTTPFSIEFCPPE